MCRFELPPSEGSSHEQPSLNPHFHASLRYEIIRWPTGKEGDERKLHGLRSIISRYIRTIQVQLNVGQLKNFCSICIVLCS